MSRVLFSETAKADLPEAWLFIAEANVDAADGVVDAIHQEAQTLSLQPLRGEEGQSLPMGCVAGQRRRAHLVLRFVRRRRDCVASVAPRQRYSKRVYELRFHAEIISTWKSWIISWLTMSIFALQL